MHDTPQHIESHTDGPPECPYLGLPGNPAKHFPMPCDANVCHVDPLGRRGYADLPLSCQVDFCLSACHRTCRYWRNAQSPALGVARFLLSQVLLAGSACLRSLRA